MLVLGYFQKKDGFSEQAMRRGGGEASSNDPVLLCGEFLIGLSACCIGRRNSIWEKHTVYCTDIIKAYRRGRGCFGGTPKSNSNGPQGFMSWVKLRAQGLVMRPKEKSLVKGANKVSL